MNYVLFGVIGLGSMMTAQADIILHVKSYTHVWAWNGQDQNLFDTWPGQQMSAEGNEWYAYTIRDDSFQNLLFSNEGSGQTTDLNREPGEWWFKENLWYDQDPEGPAPPIITFTASSSDSLRGSDSISITVSGSEVSDYWARVGRMNISLTLPTTTLKVSDFVDDGHAATVYVSATNSFGQSTQSLSFRRDDSLVVLTDDFDNLRIYQVMVESYQDGGPANFGDGYGPSHHKGDIVGITNALPYIKSLGMNAIWLTPIFESNGVSKLDATGYFCQDYFKIDDNFGTLEEAREMVNTAHDLGMYVFFDGVFGHHKGSVPASPNGNFPVGPSNPVKYPESLEFYKEVATYWIDELEIDGWRLDQAYQVNTQPNPDAGSAGRNYWAEIREAVRAKCDERKAAGKQWGTLGYLVGEIWKGENEIRVWGYTDLQGTYGLDSCFDFPMRYKMIQVLATQEYTDGGFGNSYAAPAYALSQGYDGHFSYPSWAHPNLMLTNHDLLRFGDLIQRAPHLGYGRENPDYWKRHRAALTFMASYTGPITLYYGDEYGDEVEGFVYQTDLGLYDDHVSRNSGRISGFSSDEQSLIDYTSNLMRVRDENPALWKGSRRNLIGSNTQYVDLKEYDGNRVLFALNVDVFGSTFYVNDIGGSELVDLMTGEVIGGNGNYAIFVDGLQGRLLEIR